MNTTATVSGHQQTWSSYTLAWQAQSAADRQALLARSLHPECRYADPLADVIGWPALSAYMHDLQQQIPGVHFVTTRFISHHRCSMAQWQMRDAHEAVLSEGMSFGEYEADGRLIRMNGFFDTPPAG